VPLLLPKRRGILCAGGEPSATTIASTLAIQQQKGLAVCSRMGKPVQNFPPVGAVMNFYTPRTEEEILFSQLMLGASKTAA
jgi:hypothetical protein